VDLGGRRPRQQGRHRRDLGGPLPAGQDRRHAVPRVAAVHGRQDRRRRRDPDPGRERRTPGTRPRRGTSCPG
jgi:hypothetical protein